MTMFKKRRLELIDGHWKVVPPWPVIDAESARRDEIVSCEHRLNRRTESGDYRFSAESRAFAAERLKELQAEA